MGKHLLVLGCSQTKRDCPGLLPAVDRYDGSAYRVLRKFLREHEWPQSVSVGVLSAKYGLFGGLKGIEYYDQRMSPEHARDSARQCSSTLIDWAETHENVSVALGEDYMPALQPALDALGTRANVFRGPIGMKLNQIKGLLEGASAGTRTRNVPTPGTGRIKYFLPDWDDLLDPAFDFEADAFSSPTRAERGDQHCCRLMQPKRMCDGVLVSLAQHETSKGPLRRLMGTESGSLSPTPLRKQFGLAPDQWLFGDCGAFSYVNEEKPTITVDQAVALYDIYGFDFGASLDHIPVPFVMRDGKKVPLSDNQRQKRIKITRENAERFIEAAHARKAGFYPIGTIQGLSPRGFANDVHRYMEMGYRHLAIGGLVPRSDAEIAEIVKAVSLAADEYVQRPWIHLFGIFRPKLQALFRELKIDSFDSASYFRKAWLRSDQNYLSTNENWYAAIRVPMTSDARMVKKLEENDIDLKTAQRLERRVLKLLCQYDQDSAKIKDVLDAVLSYDKFLVRSNDIRSLREQYRKTLEDRPWRRCNCAFCKGVGIHMLIFRGSNRNKRRGAHNTLMLYQTISTS